MTQEIIATGFKFANTFDDQGRRISLTLPNRARVNYTYNGAFLHRVHYNDHNFTYRARDLEGKILECELPTNLGSLIITRDALSRIASFSSPHYTAFFPKDAYDPVGNLRHYHAQDPLGKIELLYTYDALNQLISENDHTYHFDSINNRLQKDHMPYTTNHLCQTLHDGVVHYEYDVDGNLISDEKWHYTYDTQNRLIALENDDQRLEYLYDPFHRRLSKTVFIQGEQVKHEHYLWDGDNEIGVIDENNRITQLRILGEGLGAELGAAILFELNGKPYVPIHDHRGNVTLLIDTTTKQPEETYRYTAFGEELTGSDLAPWRFSSKRTDETHLVFFGRRYYLPSLGRWLTHDPEGYTDGPNLYAYVNNSPLTNIDLYGLFYYPYGQRICSSLGIIPQTYFKGLEYYGANLCIIPYGRNVIESIGRWGSGGEFFGPSRYRTGGNEIIPIAGREISHHSLTYGNGILTTKQGAIRQAEYFSQTHGNVKVDLFYNGTEGLCMDLINALCSKMGLVTAYNEMNAEYYRQKLAADPKHSFTSNVHSRGGTKHVNTSKLLSPEIKEKIDVVSYGSATIIPEIGFHSVVNNISSIDPIPMSSPFNYFSQRRANAPHINVLTPTTRNPYKEHGLLDPTYAAEIERRGHIFRKKYFNE